MASSSSSSSSSSSYSPQMKTKTYDVFISFRGADVRVDFLGFLQDALDRNGIKAFVDDNLERGEEITESLLRTIEDSYISIVIFSENYAFSPWCLDELVKILECKDKMGQGVIPVFYRINPDHVQELTGKYGEALLKHKTEFKESSVKDWSDALLKISSLSGLVSKDIRRDSKLIDEIINHTSAKLDRIVPVSSYNDGLVGIESRIQCVQSLLSLGSQDKRIIGIWGIPGMGKSTIAMKVYDQIKDQFTNHCFVANVKERLEKGISQNVRYEIFCAISGRNISNRGNLTTLSDFNMHKLGRRKVLVVLDGVSDLDQIELLIGKHDIFGSGNRIIITSIDKQLLKNVNAEIYEVRALDSREALCLFCLYAFKQDNPSQGFEKLSRRVVKHAQGNPSTLKDLGVNLYNRGAEEWEDELEKRERMSLR